MMYLRGMPTATDLRRIEHRIEELAQRLERGHSRGSTDILKELQAMSASLDALTLEVSKVKTVAAAATAALIGVQSQLAAAIAANKAGDDGAALDALAADLDTAITPLANAIPAGTVADPAPAIAAAAPPSPPAAPAAQSAT